MDNITDRNGNLALCGTMYDSNSGQSDPSYGIVLKVNLRSTNSINELFHQEFSKIIVFPNPANDKLNININEEAELIIEDVNGKVLRNAKIIYNLTEDVSKLPNGIYNLKIISKKYIQYNKLFIIQHQ